MERESLVLRGGKRKVSDSIRRREAERRHVHPDVAAARCGRCRQLCRVSDGESISRRKFRGSGPSASFLATFLLLPTSALELLPVFLLLGWLCPYGLEGSYCLDGYSVLTANMWLGNRLMIQEGKHISTM
ncbi:uncharacterized protein BO96DRAFT_16916 [Aspergillus niger CBS 101883]|uniref:uncharacterized protein n=1 Tax=Aspergillus lacticoffeatus (strain CBS 101883) TaxID=1450533 RepID=UPI000D7F3627|nr:uncharacterized protein BO96DRAFT_16916 [Aspergillus niger CBS 101883]PYH62601.1 hypothetical protein BO96DRAFT_16916 [Aspergillus niger CBS 101883]